MGTDKHKSVTQCTKAAGKLTLSLDDAQVADVLGDIVGQGLVDFVLYVRQQTLQLQPVDPVANVMTSDYFAP